MKSLLFISLFAFQIILLDSCKKDFDDRVANSNDVVPIMLNIQYKVDAQPLIFDSMLYSNDAGNQYDVSKLEYFISNITFHSSTGKDYTTTSIHYVDAGTPLTNQISLTDVPIGDYNQITFNIGLDSVHNISFSLPNTTENINMAWPDMMGGGYHFMKFEGNYRYNSSNRGYTFHLGENFSLVNCVINQSFSISSSSSALKLSMNLNEWFRSPELYDMNIDGYAIMSNKPARIKMAANGWNLFTIK